MSSKTTNSISEYQLIDFCSTLDITQSPQSTTQPFYNPYLNTNGIDSVRYNKEGYQRNYEGPGSGKVWEI